MLEKKIKKIKKIFCRVVYRTAPVSLSIILSLVVIAGCIPFKKSKQAKETVSYDKFQKQTDPLLIEQPKQLFTDFRDMKENDTVSWVWVKPGFTITACRSIEVSPVQNYSMYKYPWAEQRVYEGLKKIFSSAGSKETGSVDVEVAAAIIDMKPKKKLISRIAPFEEDFVNIEMHMMLVDKATQSLVCKITHGKRTEDFADTIDGMLEDVKQFFLKDITPQGNHTGMQ